MNLNLRLSTITGKLLLLVKFKNKPQPKLVPAKEMNLSHPQLVIEFYQARLIWNDIN
jgi:hypothetical protein